MNSKIKEHKTFLRRIALRTWNFFDEYTTNQTNYLSPDNIQGFKRLEISPYTSVTNVGFYLTSALSAHSLGYLSLRSFYDKIDLTLDALNKLEKYRGLFYSYYDLYSMKPSKPYFIPSLDNGNFLACAITLSEGLKASFDNYKFNKSLLNGLRDIIEECLLYPHEMGPAQVVKMHDIKLSLSHSEATNLSQTIRLVEKINLHIGEIKLPPIESALTLHKLVLKLRNLSQLLYEEISSFQITVDERLTESLSNHSLLELLENINNVKDLGKYSHDLNRIELLLRHEFSDVGNEVIDALTEKKNNLDLMISRRDHLVELAESYITSMDFSFFYNPKLKFVSVGYKVTRKKLEPYHYETLASESRLLVYLAICKNDIPKKSWPSLTRKIKKGKTGLFMLSWGGTTFEYFMPTIFMKYSKASIYQQTLDAYLGEQRAYTKKLDIPWGISESMYNEINSGGKYKYKAFGIPNAALNPNVDKRMVVSPYSTFITLKHDLIEGVKNLQNLAFDGAVGEYGYYEAIDYSRKDSGEATFAYMSHHQGMILTSLGNILSSNIIVKLFHSSKIVKTGEYLLEENKAGPVPTNQVILKNVKNIVYSH